jgi:hypothetical protein
MNSWLEKLKTRSQKVKKLVKYIPKVRAHLEATSYANRDEKLSVLCITLYANLYVGYTLNLLSDVESLNKWFAKMASEEHLSPMIPNLLNALMQVAQSDNLSELIEDLYSYSVALGKAKVLEYEQKFEHNKIVAEARQLFFDE